MSARNRSFIRLESSPIDLVGAIGNLGVIPFMTSLLSVLLAIALLVTGFAGGYFYRGSSGGALSQTGELRPGQSKISATDRHDGNDREDAVGPVQNIHAQTSSGRTRPSLHRPQSLARAQANQDVHSGSAVTQLQSLISSGQLAGLDHAVNMLAQSGETLQPSDIDWIAPILDLVDDVGVEQISDMLVENGSAAGLNEVISFAARNDVTLAQRRRALESLENAPDVFIDQLRPTLLQFMQSDVPGELRESAAHILGSIADDGAVDALLDVFHTIPDIHPDIVFDAIAVNGTGDDTNKLLGMLDTDLDVRAREGLLRSIGEISVREENYEQLLGLLESEDDDNVRLILGDVIAGASDPTNLDALRESVALLFNDGPALKSIAASLAQQGNRAGLDVFVEAMYDPSVAFNERTMAHTLHEYAGSDGEALMMELVYRSVDREAIEAVATRIAFDGNSASMSVLTDLLEAGNDAQRLAVAHAVGDGLPKAMSMDRLLGALSAQSDAEVTTELTRSIEKVYGANGLQGISDLLNQASDPDQRQAMVHGLEHSWTHQPNQAQSLYMQVASLDPAPQVRGQAIDVIKQQNDPALIQSLEALYVAELDPSVRDQLLGAIRELESLR